MQAPRKIICMYYNPVHSQLFTELGIFSTRKSGVSHPDSWTAFAAWLSAMLFET
jgi:hypothetical protein